jgi:ribonucleoside-diphosphate reductase alpha chain
MVVNKNQEAESFSTDKLLEHVRLCSEGLKKINVKEVVKQCVANLYDGVFTHEIHNALVNTSKSMIEKHMDYSSLASRFLLDRLYRQILGQLPVQHINEWEIPYKEKFENYIKQGIELELLNPELLDYDLNKLSQALLPKRDQKFLYLGMQTIVDRYLLKTTKKPQMVFELPQWMWMRIAMGIALSEPKEIREEKAIEFYNTISNFYLVPSTPTLFNSGTTHPQMSSCYLTTVDDDLIGIFKSFSDCARLSKFAGGIGTDWTRVRSTNTHIKGTNGTSQGIIPFLKIYNDTALAVNQGGKRKGAMCAFLEVWHADIDEFLEAKKNTGDERRRLHDINTACWIPDLFIKRVKENGKWTLFSPNEVPDLHDLYGKEFEARYEYYETQNLPSAKTIDAWDLWRKMLTMLYETGHPWITFKDAMNVRNPQDHCGVIHSSNLCTEIALNTSDKETAVCNLASLNLSEMIIDGKLDEQLLGKTVKTGMRMLDNVIDGNFYPTDEASNSNLKHRPVGLGMMGYQDALYKLNINFDSEQNLEFADYTMELVSWHAIFSSSLMAKERGTFQSYKGSKWDRGILPIDSLDLYEQERGHKITIPRDSKLDWSVIRNHIKQHGMRNSNCMAIAPTATIANIAGTTPCVEPTFKNIYMKENLSGSFVVINQALQEELRSMFLWTSDIIDQIKLNDGSIQEIKEIPEAIRRKYKETFEIEPKWIIEAAARRNKWMDQSASTNIFLKTTKGKVVSDTYMHAWDCGLKTTYYLRTLAQSQVTKTIESKSSPVVKKAPKVCSILDPDCEACQ